MFMLRNWQLRGPLDFLVKVPLPGLMVASGVRFCEIITAIHFHLPLSVRVSRGAVFLVCHV